MVYPKIIDPEKRREAAAWIWDLRTHIYRLTHDKELSSWSKAEIAVGHREHALWGYREALRLLGE